MASPTKKVFHKGDKVEVCSKQDGFLGSYYEATIKKNMGDKYLVKYKTLVEEEDESEPLEEIVMEDEVRPRPPRPKEIDPSKQQEQKIKNKFARLDRVDAYDNDGWWVGTITRKGESYCYVYFESSRDEIAYHVSKLRFHKEWLDGKWVDCNKRMRVDRKLVDRNNTMQIVMQSVEA